MGSQMAYRVPNFQCKSNQIPDTTENDSSLSDRSFMSPNSVRDKTYCFTWSPNHEEHHQSLMLRAWFLHHENTQSVQIGIRTPDLWIGVPADLPSLLVYPVDYWLFFNPTYRSTGW